MKEHPSIQNADYKPNSIYEMVSSREEPAIELDCQEMPAELPSCKPWSGLTQRE